MVENSLFLALSRKEMRHQILWYASILNETCLKHEITAMSKARWNVIAHLSLSERAARTNRAVCSKSIVRSCFRQPITKPLAPFSFKILISEFWLFFLEHQNSKNGFSKFKKSVIKKVSKDEQLASSGDDGRQGVLQCATQWWEKRVPWIHCI